MCLSPDRDKHRGYQLYQSDPSGNYGGWKATAIGANHQAATNVLQGDYKDELSLEEVRLPILLLVCVAAVFVPLLCVLLLPQCAGCCVFHLCVLCFCLDCGAETVKESACVSCMCRIHLRVSLSFWLTIVGMMCAVLY
jgi:hypothetical protein